MPFLVAFAPLAPDVDSLSPSHPTPAWERAPRACPTVTPPCPLSSAARIDDIFFPMSLNVTIFVSLLPLLLCWSTLHSRSLRFKVAQGVQGSARIRAIARLLPANSHLHVGQMWGTTPPATLALPSSSFRPPSSFARGVSPSGLVHPWGRSGVPRHPIHQPPDPPWRNDY